MNVPVILRPSTLPATVTAGDGAYVIPGRPPCPSAAVVAYAIQQRIGAQPWPSPALPTPDT